MNCPTSYSILGN